LIGLGNPGSKYRNTLHNAGHLLVDWLKKGSHETPFPIKTSSFMNESGKDVLKILKKWGSAPKGPPAQAGALPQFMIAHDDIDIPLGKFKVTFGNTSGGHKGVQSVIDSLGTKNFWRIRIGVQLLSYDPKVDKAEDWVLGEFTEEQLGVLREVFPDIKKFLINLINLNNSQLVSLNFSKSGKLELGAYLE